MSKSLTMITKERVMKKLLVLAVGLSVLGFAVPAPAADHLFNATNANGAEQRGFGNPVTDPSKPGNAINVSKGDAAPGEGDPKVGEDTGHPSVEVEALNPTAQEHVPFGEE
jgi:hypothetical protein